MNPPPPIDNASAKETMKYNSFFFYIKPMFIAILTFLLKLNGCFYFNVCKSINKKKEFYNLNWPHVKKFGKKLRTNVLVTQ